MNEESIGQFFKAYESRFNAALAGNDDVEGTRRSFADCFIEASPAGIQCAKNDEQFSARIPKGNAFYRSIGTTVMKITGMEIDILDDWHAMVEVYWHSRYRKNNGPEEIIDFSVFYLLQELNNELKIFAYITGDEQKILREKGLLPE